MKILKIIVAFLLTIALYYIASTNSRGQSEFLTHSENGYTFEFHTVPKAFENSSAEIPISINGDFTSGQKVRFRKIIPGNDINNLNEYESLPVKISDSTKFLASVNTGHRGGRFYYYFEVVDSNNISLAKMTEEDNQPFLFKYIGHVPFIVIAIHILFIIFVVPFCISLATANSFSLVTGASTNVKPVAKLVMWSVIFCFLGGYLIGFAMNWYAFACFWEGVPFGTDATDNKTQLLFVYNVFAMLSMWGSLRGNPGKNLYSSKTLGWIGIGLFIVMLFIYLIPHSIQFTKELTYAACYSYIILFILIYIVSLIKRKSQTA